MSDIQKNSNGLRKWFPWIASFVLFWGAMFTGYAVHHAAITGEVCWQPFPAFALLTVLMLAANWFIYREEGD